MTATFQSWERFSTQYTAGATVVLRLMRMSDGWIWDNTAVAFAANAALAITPDLPCDERTDLGDATNSEFTGGWIMGGANGVHEARQPQQYLVQFRDTAGPTVIATEEIKLACGQIIAPGRLSM